jgi:hypothetical protein
LATMRWRRATFSMEPGIFHRIGDSGLTPLNISTLQLHGLSKRTWIASRPIFTAGYRYVACKVVEWGSGKTDDRKMSVHD